ncbi:MAG: DUF3806 domain-containing protein [Planctomycetota bacterium]|jgi:hypothetical protein
MWIESNMAKVLIGCAVVLLLVLLVWSRLKRSRSEGDKGGYYALETRNSANEMSESPTFTELSDSDRKRLDAQRAIVLDVLREKYWISALRNDKHDLALLQRLIDDGVFSIEQTIELQSMGVVLGDILVEELGLQWIMITDQYGTDPTVHIPETTVCFNVLTMVSKRIEESREVDVNKLFQIVEAEVRRFRLEEK